MVIYWVFFVGDVVKVCFEYGFFFFLCYRGFLNDIVKLYVEFFNKNIIYDGY